MSLLLERESRPRKTGKTLNSPSYIRRETRIRRESSEILDYSSLIPLKITRPKRRAKRPATNTGPASSTLHCFQNRQEFSRDQKGNLGFLALNREPVSSLKVAAYRSILPSRRMLFGGCLGLASRQTKVLSALEHSTPPGKPN